ncbi:hypothetical protein K474DRAFT_1713629 [Panus rudis PR-1116 ss-1]|nr:hypothetical protein K474DRAFT_1713629 [Panus rudis PR-1116 ss-1]
MGRKKVSLPAVPKGMTTRAKNKDAHPGVPDMPQPRRSSHQVAEAKAAEAEADEAAEKVRQVAVSEAADVEAEILQEDAAFEAQARRPPTPQTAAPANNSGKRRPKQWTYGDLEPGISARPMEFESEDEGYAGDRAIMSSSEDSSEAEKPQTKGKKKKQRLLRAAIGKARDAVPAGKGKRKEVSLSPERSATGENKKLKVANAKQSATEAAVDDDTWAEFKRQRAQRKAARRRRAANALAGVVPESAETANSIKGQDKGEGEDNEDDNETTHAANFLDDEEEEARLLQELAQRKRKDREAQALPKLIDIQVPKVITAGKSQHTSGTLEAPNTKTSFGKGFLFARNHNQITTVVAKMDQPAAPSGSGGNTASTVKGKQPAASGSGLNTGSSTSTLVPQQLRIAHCCIRIVFIAANHYGAAAGEPVNAVVKPEQKSKWTTMHIPESMRALFSSKMIPRARALAGSNALWGPFLVAHTQAIYDKTYQQSPGHPTSYTVTNQDVYHSVVNYRVSDWRNKIAFYAMTGLEPMFEENTAGAGQEPDDEHPIPFDEAARKECIKETVLFLLSDGKKEVPYHWGVWGEKKKGTFQGELILHTFANAHLSVFKALGPQDTFLKELQVANPPIGALILSIQAVCVHLSVVTSHS